MSQRFIRLSLQRIFKRYGSTSRSLDPYEPRNSVNSTLLKSIEPPIKKSFNLASFVNQSKTLQRLLDIKVSLFDIENTNYDAARKLIKLDYDRDCKPYIEFLLKHGLKKSNLGRFISEYPDIFSEYMDDLETRINYLESKGFSKDMIAKGLNRSSHIIRHKTKSTDFKLGLFQVEFGLTGDQIRSIFVKYPQLITLPKEQFIVVKFVIIEEFGFEKHEVPKLLDSQPKLMQMDKDTLFDRLDFVHNIMELSHSTIVRFPKLITAPIIELRYRHNYLKKLNRNQYDPKKPLYVIPSALYNLSDHDFCVKCAKTTLEDYKLFLKSC